MTPHLSSQVSGSGADGYDNADVIMAMSVEGILYWIMDLGGSYRITYMIDYFVDFEEYDGGKILLGDGKECRIRGTGKVQVQMRDGSSFVLDNVMYVLELRNMGFNESREYKKTFIGSSDTGSVQVLQGVEFEVISKRKTRLKEEMDARSDVYVLNNGCKKYRDDNDGYYWEYTLGNVLGMKIVRDQSGNTLRVSQSRFYNKKLVQTLLERHSILSLEGSLSRNCDVGKNDKWSCIYAVGIQEYQMVCTRLDIASTNVGMLDKFDRGLQTDVQVFVDFDYTMGRSITVIAEYITLTEAAKEAIWLKGLAIESGFELNIVAGIATGALSKAIPGLRFQQRLNLLSI
ncbi:hypothetical protein Tco_1104425, partial [Tanacetum coccineum]